jgi:hypothetical protein
MTRKALLSQRIPLSASLSHQNSFAHVKNIPDLVKCFPAHNSTGPR